MRNYATQMDAARKGIITPEMEAVAEKEYRTPEEIRDLVAKGQVAICANRLHTCLQPNGVGSMLRTKINVNLGDKMNTMPNNLSGGQQRVAIARALVSKPAIVLADEPTGNLDSRTSQDMLSLLRVTSTKFHQTLVMITHNNEIAQLADRIIRIEDGKIFE